MNVKGTIGRLAILLFLACLLTVLGGPPAGAVAMRTAPQHYFVVISADDTHDANPGNCVCADGLNNCSLRAAVEESNACPGDDTIDLQTLTYNITLGTMAVNSNIAIEGDNTVTTILDGTGNGGEAFSVSAGRLELSQMTIRDFTYSGAIENIAGTVVADECAFSNNVNISVGLTRGGAIYNEGGNVTITNSTLANNSARYGGAISNDSGTVSISQFTTLSGNSAIYSMNSGGCGGAIYTINGTVNVGWLSDIVGNDADIGGGGICAYSSSVNVSLSDISGNSVPESSWRGGGGILATNSAVTLEDTRLLGNQAPTGGGVYSDAVDEGTASLVVTASSVTTNTVAEDGGGIFFDAPDDPDEALVVTNSTISGNEANGSGGGIRVEEGRAELYNVTIADNTADADGNDTGNGGGVSTSGYTTFWNTIVARNHDTYTGYGFTYFPDCVGTMDSGGFNLVGVVQLCFIDHPTRDHIGTRAAPIDPLLGPLEIDGYYTDYHPLLEGSLAVDGGNPSGCRDHTWALLADDQRGEVRHFSHACDIGAYESLFSRWSVFLPLLVRGG